MNTANHKLFNTISKLVIEGRISGENGNYPIKSHEVNFNKVIIWRDVMRVFNIDELQLLY